MSSHEKYIEQILARSESAYLKKLLEDPADTIEEPFLKEFSQEFTNFLQKSKDNSLLISSFEYDTSIEELEELEEHQELDFVDIEKLNELEKRVITVLQYLNLDLYKEEKIKELIITSVLERLTHEELEGPLKQKVEDVIQYLVEHEFEELSKKKRDRRKILIEKMLDYATPFIEKSLDEHEKFKVKKVNSYQKENYIRYLLKESEVEIFEKIREELDINIEEYRFLKNILLIFTTKRYNAKLNEEE